MCIRDRLYDVIMEEAVSVGVGYAGPARIDEINILQATYEAMREAVSKLTVRPQILLNDAVTIPQMDIPQVPIKMCIRDRDHAESGQETHGYQCGGRSDRFSDLYL